MGLQEGGLDGVRLEVDQEGMDQKVVDQGVDQEGVDQEVGQEGVGQEGVSQEGVGQKVDQVGAQKWLDHREVTPLKARVVVAVASKRRFKGS